MKEILLVLVGGTICTACDENGILSIYEEAGVQLKANFENSASPYAKTAHIDLTENLMILSENMSIENWNRILSVYRAAVTKKRYDGVIFAHGTDTLAYSAALFSMLLADTDIPVFFVSSNARLDSPRANGDANFACAVECICKGIVPNVYVTYKNISDGKMYLHLASHLQQCKNYSEDFYSRSLLCLEKKDNEYIVDTAMVKKMYPPKERKMLLPADITLNAKVLLLVPYVGIDYDAYDYSRFSAVLHGTYHSGTARAEKTDSVLTMLVRCASLTPQVDVYLAPSKDSGEIYETVSQIANYRVNERQIHLLDGMTMECAYAKLLLAYSAFDNAEARYAFLHTNCNFEFEIGGCL